MKKSFIAIIFICITLLSAGILYANAARHLGKQPEYIHRTDDRELTLPEVKQTSVVPEPDVTYTVKYEIRTLTYREGWRIKSKEDTTNIWLQAEGNSTETPKPHLPQGGKFSWGTLKL